MTDQDKLQIIEAEVCNYLRIDASKLHTRNRKREVCEARFAVFSFGREFTRMSLGAMGREYNKDHASVLHGCRTIDNLIRFNGWGKKSEELRIRITERINGPVPIDYEAWMRAMGMMITDYETEGRRG